MAGADLATLLREGDFAGALAGAKDLVRKQPANAAHRVLLFQLFTVGGEWDKALTQLEVVGELDGLALPMVQTYREVLRCETLRRGVFAGERLPMLFGEPEPWVALLFEALRMTTAGNHAQARQLREQVFEQAPASAGSIDGQEFEWIADADTRLGPMLEAIINGRYFWVPFARIKTIELEAPVDLRDVVWTPAQFTWANGGEMVGFVPTRYCGSERHADNRVLLSRMTVWEDLGEETFIGHGQRLLTTDAGDYPLLDTRRIEFSVGAADGDSAAE